MTDCKVLEKGSCTFWEGFLWLRSEASLQWRAFGVGSRPWSTVCVGDRVTLSLQRHAILHEGDTETCLLAF